MEIQTTLLLKELKIENLPQLKKWEEAQRQLVRDNPFIEVEDNKSYEEAKKRRTALVKGRTALQSQKKVIIDPINNFKKAVDLETNRLIEITLPYEEKQQEEVKVYEAKKAEDKAEKLRIEQERKEAIKDRIKLFKSSWMDAFSKMCHSEINQNKNEFESKIQEVNAKDFEEFQLDYLDTVDELKLALNKRVEELEKEEVQRLEGVRLKAERIEIERQKVEQDEKNRKAQEEINEAKAKLEDEKKVIKAEKKRLKKLEDERLAEIQVKKKIEREAIAKKKAEEEAKIKAKAEAKRIEALRPDKEKLESYIKSVIFSIEPPVLENEDSKNQLKLIQESLGEWSEIELNNLLNNLK